MLQSKYDFKYDPGWKPFISKTTYETCLKADQVDPSNMWNLEMWQSVIDRTSYYLE